MTPETQEVDGDGKKGWFKHRVELHQRAGQVRLSGDARRLLSFIIEAAESWPNRPPPPPRALRFPLSHWAKLLGVLPHHIPRLLVALVRAGLIKWTRGSRCKKGDSGKHGVIELCIAVPELVLVSVENNTQAGTATNTSSSTAFHSDGKKFKRTDEDLTAVPPLAVQGTTHVENPANGNGPADHKLSEPETAYDANFERKGLLRSLNLTLVKCGISKKERNFVCAWLEHKARSLTRDGIIDFVAMVINADEINAAAHGNPEKLIRSRARWALDQFSKGRRETSDRARQRAKSLLAFVEGVPESGRVPAPSPIAACIPDLRATRGPGAGA